MDVGVRGRSNCALFHPLPDGWHLAAVVRAVCGEDCDSVERLVLATLVAACRSRSSPSARLRDGMRGANRLLWRRFGSSDDRVYAACSATVVLVRGTTAWIAQAGSTAGVAAAPENARALTDAQTIESPGAMTIVRSALGCDADILVDPIKCDLRDAVGLVLSTHAFRRSDDAMRLLDHFGDASAPSLFDDGLYVPTQYFCRAVADRRGDFVRRCSVRAAALALAFIACTCAR